MQISMFRDSILYCHWKAGLPWTPLKGKILLEDRTCPGYSVSCTSCNLCKDDGVVHACAVCFTKLVGTCLKGNFVLLYMDIHLLCKFPCYS